MDIKRCLCLLVAFLLPAGAGAQSPELAPDHPDEYVVVKGDTLWDISGRFLAEPWQWPALWRANPHIENPHLIYPGDRLRLEYRDGEPVLTLRRGGRPVVKLSPQVRVSERADAIPTIPLEAISPFLSSSRIVAEDALDSAPYVVSVGRKRIAAGTRDRIYVRGVPAEAPQRFAVFRKGPTYQDPQDGEVLGTQAVHVADVALEKEGDPATFRVIRAKREVLTGDRLLSYVSGEDTRPFVPRAPDTAVDGTIVAVLDGVSQIGRDQVVVLDLGRADGIAPGHVLAVMQEGGLVADRFTEEDRRPPIPEGEHNLARDVGHMLDLMGDAIGSLAPDSPPTVALPDERAGLVMVFRSFDDVSYALVMESTRAMHVLDRVANP